ncbi:anti-sigma B factor antagonist/stage II sporulation protein AA (anti-sigma F factor antagonist) [Granulicella rosea]|uniref:Anti-sigma B factor antagonist/stage II sporulation protein AA (Anti-sigma F factor antagonist) n=1 Tax=Granulicella rosea TaxID=474952 RepID=A0A239KVW5_9BACT|nr:STAS domain-containing protein [Granulicella rosea]SNT21659.1 anti-sigma B factor antagonist/stage II sporulation protein AA (anti-sigma F factor antagonist) [Granulicella rosea]
MSDSPLTLTLEEHGATTIIHCKGKLVYGHTAPLSGMVDALIPTHKHIILDLAELTHMDSMGLGALVRLYVSARTHHCRLELRNLGERIRELMIMTNLLPVFSIVGESGLKMM